MILIDVKSIRFKEQNKYRLVVSSRIVKVDFFSCFEIFEFSRYWGENNCRNKNEVNLGVGLPPEEKLLNYFSLFRRQQKCRTSRIVVTAFRERHSSSNRGVVKRPSSVNKIVNR